MVRVEVLLATFNGENHLNDFLESLANQINVHIDLVVSDDSSTDSTLSIIQSFEHRFHSLKIMSGPCLGPKENFAKLIRNSGGRYIAFADQDDIWAPNHLINAVAVLEKNSSAPSLTFSSAYEFKEGNKKLNLWPDILELPSLETLLTENVARGCTIILNEKLIDLLKSSDFSEIYMHDWWSLLVGRTCGTVFYQSSPSVLYRIHSGNTVGSKKSFMQRCSLFYSSNFKARYWYPVFQSRLLLRQFGSKMGEEERAAILKFSIIEDRPFGERCRYFFQSEIRLRLHFTEDISLKLFLLFFQKTRRPHATEI